MDFKLIYPLSGRWWVSDMSAGIVTAPWNKDFDPEHVIARLGELRETGQHTYVQIDGEELPAGVRSMLYTEAQ